MSEKKRGLLQGLFGAKSCGCCNTRIEEISEGQEQPKGEPDAGEDAAGEKAGKKQPPCCGRQP